MFLTARKLSRSKEHESRGRVRVRLRRIWVYKSSEIKENQQYLNSSELSETHFEFFWILSEFFWISSEFSEIIYKICEILQNFRKLLLNSLELFWAFWRIHSIFFQNLFQIIFFVLVVNFEKSCESKEILTHNWIILKYFFNHKGNLKVLGIWLFGWKR